MLQELLIVDMGGSKIKEVQLIFLSIVGEIRWIWIALHDAHLKDLAKCQLHEQPADLISDVLRDVFLLKATDSYSFEELRG